MESSYLLGGVAALKQEVVTHARASQVTTQDGRKESRRRPGHIEDCSLVNQLGQM